MAVSYPVTWNGLYKGRLTEEQAQLIMQIRGMDGVPGLSRKLFNFPPSLVLRSIKEQKSLRQIVKEENIDYTQYIGTLRPYQTLGTAFMYASPRSILGDGVGAGKTAEISALINLLKERNQITRFLMAVESSALGQTRCELIKFTGLNIIELPSRAHQMKKVIENTKWSQIDGVVTTHSALRSDLLLRWISMYLDEAGMSRIFSCFVLDESSVIKNRGTKTFEYTNEICNRVDRVHMLNATTFETSIMDIYNQMDIMDDTLLPKAWRIEKEFCTYQTVTYWTRDKKTNKPNLNKKYARSGYKNQAAFKQALQLVYFGRSKKEIGKELPHIYRVYEVAPNNDQSMAIEKGHRYNEVLNCPSLIPELGLQCDRKSVPKLNRLVELVQNEFSNDRVMVYCFHIEAQEAIYREMEAIGRHPVILNGATSQEIRWSIQEQFNTGEKDVLITNIQKSLNLYGGDACIFYSMVANPSRMEQVRGRIDRSIDDKIKTYILLLYKGTDEYKLFTEVARQRAKDSRDLTIDAESAVDFFIKAMELQSD